MEQQTYTKRSGTTNKGLEYEVLGIANYAIDLVTDTKVKNFHISSNHPDFGAFDDIVIETEQENCTEVFAIQLKHKDGGILTLTQLLARKGDFSLKKYFDSTQSIEAAETNFILYTNLKFNFVKDKKLYLDGEHFPIRVTKINPKETFKISGKTDFCYKFSIVEDECSYEYCPEVLLFKRFFRNFFLYTNQENSHDLKRSISEKFKSSFCGSDVECNEYVRFVSEWSSKDGKIEKLNKEWVTLAVALKVFSSRVKPLSFNSNIDVESTQITRRDILREAIDTFDVSIFGKESYDEVKKLWVDTKNELTELKMINKLRMKYYLNSAYISDIAKVDALTLTLLLWLTGKAPLILPQYANVSRAIELCVGKKFIFLSDDRVNSFSENISLFKMLFDLKSKTSQYDKLIQNFMCSVQGKPAFSLENLVRDGEISRVLKTDHLLEMVKGPCHIGEAKENLSEPYIERYLLKNVIDFKILDNLNKETAVVLDCVSQKPDLKKALTNHKLINISNFLKAEERPNIVDSVEKLSNSCTIYLSEQRCEHSEFKEICNRVKKSKIFHQFRIKPEGNLEWIRSRGGVSDIEKYKLSQYYYVQESDFESSDFKNKINLLASDPGMGKSELMKSFKINSFSEFFTIIVNPKDVYSFLKNTRDVTNYADAFFKFLLDDKYKMPSERDNAIFRIFLKQHKIIIVWDSLDELSNEHKDIVSNIIVELSKNFLQWVTSRRHLLNNLQERFKVLALNLNKFEEQEQRYYIQRRLAHLDNTETIETILKKISSSFALVEHKDILGIPLQIFMLTELLRQDKEKYLDLLGNFFLLTDLYNHFIEEKSNILFREKLQIDLNTASAAQLVQMQKNQILELYTRAALRLLFSDEILSKMSIHNIHNFEGVCENHQNIGLITEIKDNIPRFIHNSFAEYLAARYFANHLQNKDILTQVMFDPKYTNVRFFFDLFLARDSKVHIAILYKNYSFIKSCDSEIFESTDLGGRSVLHLACSWGQKYPELTIKHSGDCYLIDHEGKFNSNPESNEYLEVIDCLLEKSDIYKPDEVYNITPREYARKSTCLPAEMRIVMKQNTETAVDSDHMINALYCSVYCGYHHEFEFYFKLFKQVWATRDNVRHSLGSTWINVAAANGYIEILQILVKGGADINLPTKDGYTPLYVASLIGHETVVEALLKAGAGINLPNKDSYTPLHVASMNGHETLLETLLKAGADINLPNINGYTPLFIASRSGHETLVTTLLKSGADFNLHDKDGYTPLHIASLTGHETIVETLLKAGADINLPNKDGWTPLYIASLNGHGTVVDLLLKAGAGINLPNKDGYTPLHEASMNGYETVVKTLLKAGADINLPTKDGYTPLYVASLNGHETVVEALLKAGASINLSNKDGYTPLHVASMNGHETLLETLLQAGADINLPNINGYTPLFIAFLQGHETVVEMLLKAGAGSNLPDKDGFTPL